MNRKRFRKVEVRWIDKLLDNGLLVIILFLSVCSLIISFIILGIFFVYYADPSLNRETLLIECMYFFFIPIFVLECTYKIIYFKKLDTLLEFILIFIPFSFFIIICFMLLYTLLENIIKTIQHTINNIRNKTKELKKENKKEVKINLKKYNIKEYK